MLAAVDDTSPDPDKAPACNDSLKLIDNVNGDEVACRGVTEITRGPRLSML